MNEPKNVLVWREFESWGPRILELMSNVITPIVMEIVRQEPPEYCHGWDPTWLQNALDKAGVQASPIQTLTGRLPKEYPYIRAYHACRPTNIEELSKYLGGVAHETNLGNCIGSVGSVL